MQENEKHINLIFRFLTKEANEVETESFNNLIAQNASNKKLFDSYNKTWELSSNYTEQEVLDINIEDEWQKISKQINFNETKSNIRELKTRKFQIWKFAVGIAAILIISFGLLFIFSPKQETIIAENKIVETELIDGTQITLNLNSQISYSKKYNSKNRNIKLEGEAYFKVQHNPKKPFIIETKDFYVEVIGTEFYVSAIQNNPQVIVTSGKVLVYTKKDSKTITAGEKINFNFPEKLIKIETNKNLNYLSWKTKKIIFKDNTIEEVTEILEKTYNVKIKILNPKINSYTLNVVFDNQSIESVLEVIKATLNLTIQKKGNIIEIDCEGC